jgi:antitoxin component of RelBE/YafQ-DinJ toxin-antitoxin module
VRKRKNMEYHVSFRVTPDVMKEVQALAERKGISYSDIWRMTMLERLEQDKKGK